MNIYYLLTVIIVAIIDNVWSTVVTTTSGRVRGLSIDVLNQSVDQFLGIPFAEPPIGDLRFAKPKPMQRPLSDEIDATRPKSSCVQRPNIPLLNEYTVAEETTSEDCLCLNVWTQSPNINSGRLKPVMIWLYGGGLSVGSSFLPHYNGSVLATYDVVVVSTNYRVGVFGFLFGNHSDAPGNMGFYDQILAFKWVHNNIHLFGGDRNQITLFGQSSGSWSISAHIISPVSRGLFRRAIFLSGAFFMQKDNPIMSPEDSLSLARKLAKRVNCSDDNTWISCLKKVKPVELLNNMETTVILSAAPIMGTEFLPMTAQKAFYTNQFNKGLQLMTGFTTNESTIFLPDIFPDLYTPGYEPSYYDMIRVIVRIGQLVKGYDMDEMSDMFFSKVKIRDPAAVKRALLEFIQPSAAECPVYLFAKRYAQRSDDKNNVFGLVFNYAANKDRVSKYGIYHGADLAFVFGLPLLRNNNNYTEEDIEFSRTVVRYWTHFAKHGFHPNIGERVSIYFINNVELVNCLHDYIENRKPDESSLWKPLLSENKTYYVRSLEPKTTDHNVGPYYDSNCEGVWSKHLDEFAKFMPS